MYDYYLRSNPPNDELDTIHIRQFLHYMKDMEIDAEYDLTGKSTLIYHDGIMYLNIVESLDTLEQNILVFLNSLLEGS